MLYSVKLPIKREHAEEIGGRVLSSAFSRCCGVPIDIDLSIFCWFKKHKSASQPLRAWQGDMLTSLFFFLNG